MFCSMNQLSYVPRQVSEEFKSDKGKPGFSRDSLISIHLHITSGGILKLLWWLVNQPNRPGRVVLTRRVFTLNILMAGSGFRLERTQSTEIFMNPLSSHFLLHSRLIVGSGSSTVCEEQQHVHGNIHDTKAWQSLLHLDTLLFFATHVTHIISIHNYLLWHHLTVTQCSL